MISNTSLRGDIFLSPGSGWRGKGAIRNHKPGRGLKNEKQKG